MSKIGVDVGGTFTDVMVVEEGDEGSSLRVFKTPSTPQNPEEGVVEGLKQVGEETGTSLDSVGYLSHGTTVATNAVLERDWSETALVTTRGFRDVLEIARQTREDLYDLQTEKTHPVVERDLRYEVSERVDEDGEVVEPVDEDEVREVAEELKEKDIESVAVSFLFSFENPEHEERVAEILRDEGVESNISLSSEVLPEIREYERTLVTSLNAVLKPVMSRYIRGLEEDNRGLGVPAELNVMQSSGGVFSAEDAREKPVNTLLSGPAAGVKGASYVAGLRDENDIITLDMGGTSCDVSVVTDSEPVVSSEVEVGGYDVGVRSVDVHTVGAGGGSVAWVDEGGALRVGPRSAGARPGPVCYGRGGEEVTTTDAHYVLGRLEPDFLDDPEPRSEVIEVLRDEIAEPLGMEVEEAAEGVLDVANARMARALRVVSVERGYDPRDFSLVAFGGAGPLHASSLASELDIPRVVVPRAAGVLSALGLLTSDVVHDLGVS
ncbi:MAG: hydantoinase/oxoprolinase family protein, partial [Halobacteria archaeon]|nr:hydantoinase/oxoprolinase family protein [Halobacteria archaeon]